jgi:hypothetical protein
VAVASIAVALAGGSPAWAQPPAPAQHDEEIRALRRAIEAIAESQRRIESQLGELRGLLQGRAAQPPAERPRNVLLSLADLPAKGDPKARLVLVDFTDYQ